MHLYKEGGYASAPSRPAGKIGRFSDVIRAMPFQDRVPVSSGRQTTHRIVQCPLYDRCSGDPAGRVLTDRDRRRLSTPPKTIGRADAGNGGAPHPGPALLADFPGNYIGGYSRYAVGDYSRQQGHESQDGTDVRA